MSSRRLTLRDAKYQFQVNEYLEDAAKIADERTHEIEISTTGFQSDYDKNKFWDRHFHRAMDQLTKRAGLRTQAWQMGKK